MMTWPKFLRLLAVLVILCAGFLLPLLPDSSFSTAPIAGREFGILGLLVMACLIELWALHEKIK